MGPLVREALTTFQRLGDKKQYTHALTNLAITAWAQGDYLRARELSEECLAISRELGDKRLIANGLNDLGLIVREMGDYAGARTLLDESLSLRRELSDKRHLGQSLLDTGATAHAQNDAAALVLLQEGLAIFQELGDKLNVARCLHDLGRVVASQGKLESAHSYFVTSLALFQELGDRRNLIKCLEGLAGIFVANKRAESGARLFGASEALRQQLGVPIPGSYRANYDQTIATLRARLDGAQLARLWAEGRMMSVEQATEYALAEQTAVVQPADVLRRDPNGLTPREIEVLRLVSAGLSDVQIADQLVLSPRTINTHLTSIYSKLGVNSRSAATRLALDRKLI
jgi:DNA-binding CsgD family transcriptional regulator